MGTLGPVARCAMIVILAVFGAVAAFATIAPPIDAQILLSSRSSIEALTIPREALLPSPSSYIREERFQRGDTLAAFLSLFAASDAAGIPDSVAMQLADIFGGDIDFHRDLRKGDQFTVVYELHHLAGRPVRAGKVLAAEFVSRGKAYRAVNYLNGYFAPDGGNLRKAFLRAPLEFSRV